MIELCQLTHRSKQHETATTQGKTECVPITVAYVCKNKFVSRDLKFIKIRHFGESSLYTNYCAYFTGNVTVY